jgi:hypothetical protein
LLILEHAIVMVECRSTLYPAMILLGVAYTRDIGRKQFPQSRVPLGPLGVWDHVAHLFARGFRGGVLPSWIHPLEPGARLRR